jgi:hypothetical protein
MSPGDWNGAIGRVARKCLRTVYDAAFVAASMHSSHCCLLIFQSAIFRYCCCCHCSCRDRGWRRLLFGSSWRTYDCVQGRERSEITKVKLQSRVEERRARGEVSKLDKVSARTISLMVPRHHIHVSNACSSGKVSVKERASQTIHSAMSTSFVSCVLTV